MIHLGRGATRLGSYPEETVRAGLGSGRFFPTDLGWREGMENWKPLAEFPELTEPLPALPPEEEDEAVAREAEPLEPRPGLPWENPEGGRLALAFPRTVWLVLRNPARAFQRMRLTGGMLRPLSFGFVGAYVGLLLLLTYQGVMVYLTHSTPQGTAGLPPALAAIGPRQALAALLSGAIFGPVFILVGLLVLSIFTHVCLMMVGGAREPLQVTMRVICYSVGAACMMLIIPGCGPLVALACIIVCQIVGLAQAHEIPFWRSAVAVLLPIIVCCGSWLAIVLQVIASGQAIF